MRAFRPLLALAVFEGLCASIFASCGGGGETSGAGAGAGTGTASGSSSGGGASSSGSSGAGGAGSDAGCFSSTDCANGGVCVGGACCAKANSCNDVACCGSGEVCLVDKCVKPGKGCHTQNDCGPGQYCETALGEAPDGGVPDGGADGGLCLAPLPLGGKCLDLPPVCAGDAGVPGPDAGCFAQCEYHPPPGQLNAVPKWQWGPTATVKPNFTDVWSTPTVGRVYDGNCDGKIDELDSPTIIFVSGDQFAGAPNGSNCQGATGNGGMSMCHSGVLRMLDGRTGQEIWTLDKASAGSVGFSGVSVALGDVDNDGRVDVTAVTGEGYVVLIDSYGNVKRQSDKPIPGNANTTFGWGGGLSLADLDGDGFSEIAYGATVFSTTGGKITLKFTGVAGIGGGAVYEALSTIVDLDGAPDNHLELLAGNVAYRADGTVLWNRPGLPDGFPGVGDFNKDGKPDVVLVGPQNVGGKNQAFVWILNGADGTTLLGPVQLPTVAHPSDGGPPTVADYDGDGKPEIGVATADFYWMLKPDFVGNKIDIVWKTPNHDFSSSVTGSSVFDFEGDGKAEVIYADECFLWVFDGQTGAVRFAAPHTSFTGTEASLVADVDGDGRAEIVMVTNGADPSANGWGCMNAASVPVTMNGVTWTPSNLPNKSYRGIVAFGDSASSWVGTRTLWSEHTYHVSNICDDRDTACDAPNVYGSIPKVEKKNWTVPWLNDFRQNVQDKGLFDAPDAVVSLAVDCVSPVAAHVAVRNIGLASLPAGVDAGVFTDTSPPVEVGVTTTTHVLFPGQTEELDVSLDPAKANKSQSFYAKILIDPNTPKFHECREDNDQSATVKPNCVN